MMIIMGIILRQQFTAYEYETYKPQSNLKFIIRAAKLYRNKKLHVIYVF